MTLTDNPEIIAPLRFLREREIVHYQRFGECLEIVQSMIPNNNAKLYSGFGEDCNIPNCNCKS